MQARPAAVGAQIVFTLNRDASVAVEVRNVAGRLVRTISAATPAVGGELTTLAWDGRSSAGTKAPAGRYLVVVTATTEDGQSAKAVGTLKLQ
jgi:flagellar hook assembly protein FlgD